MELIDRQAALKKMCETCGYCEKFEKAMRATHPDFVTDKCNNYKFLAELPTIKPEVRHGGNCEYCKGRSYTKKPLTVITRTMKRVEVCFNFCPNCGRDMRATDTNVGGKGGNQK